MPKDVEVLRKAQPEVLLLHANGGDSDFEIVSRLRDFAPEIKVLLLMDATDEEKEFQAIRAGSCGCISIASDLDNLMKVLSAIRKGEIWVSRLVASRLISKLSEAQDSPNTNGLMPVEWKVLGLLASGTRNKEIANRLSVSEKTVKTHLDTIYRKINVDCRLAATLYYFHHVKSDGKYPRKSAPPQRKLKRKNAPRSGQAENLPAK
jgi:DNA-binding NarL/FixJ family response regulator